MKKRWLTKKWSLLVIRDATQGVKQVDVPMMLLVSVPLLTAVSVSSYIVGLKMNAASQIEGLQHTIHANATASKLEVQASEQTIDELQNEIIRLSSDAQSMKARMEHINTMESTLQSLIQKYAKTDQPKETIVTSLPWDAMEDIGGDYFPVDQDEIMRLAQETTQEYDQMEAILDVMRQNVSNTVQHVKDVFQNTPTGWPTSSRRLTSSFGYRRDPMTRRAAFHAGVDIAGSVGDPVFAAADGKVITTGSDGSRGKYIVIEHSKGYQTWYMHLHRIDVREDERIVKGERIGRLGNTGRSTGPHLHFQIVKEDQPIDPLPFIMPTEEE
ncbi:hypothetical protein BVG16_25445 [Paenibacillus selenitireducens]|uniref:M23ase beta-sheet core domain-containing protein n=1 Tax=Paenibacillus selenitireducens TaxID=1324314 RepID=A0A1T2X2N2_9BACL|nr:M23 family metallopeptidase [Paenibacillus selenitireducens]OPA74097.1 hypothetical protein BVG16_25445 [Paenibacillus selenitireducens]